MNDLPPGPDNTPPGTTSADISPQEKKWVSTCCGAPPRHGELDNMADPPTGICTGCHEGATFEVLDEE